MKTLNQINIGTNKELDLQARNISLSEPICDLLGLDSKRFPLRRYCVYSGSDFGRGSEIVSRMAGNRFMEPLADTPDRILEIHRAQLSFSQLAVAFNNIPCRLRFSEPLQHFTFIVPLNGYHRITVPGSEYIVEPGQGYLLRPGQIPEVFRSENSVVVVANLSGEGYQQLFGFGLEQAMDSRSEDLPVMYDLLNPKYRIFLSIFGTLCKSLDEEENTHLRQDSVIRSLEQALWYQFDDLVPPLEPEVLVERDLSNLPKNIKKAVDYIHENADSEITLLDLERAAGVSSRSVQSGFKEWLGVRPMSYVKKLRLAKVRSDLLIADPESTFIGDIAAHWGFFHLSKFAQDYRNEFGELPSETIKRERE